MRLLIADDHPIFRKGLVDYIQEVMVFDSLIECADGGEAWRYINEGQIDICMLDVNMPEMTGLQILKQIKQHPSLNTKCVILTMYNEYELLYEALEYGVMGYLLKEDAISEIADCITAVQNNRPFVTPKLSQALIKQTRPQHRVTWEQQLTPTEIEILKRIAHSHSTKEIAKQLGISIKTVENHRFNICKKVGISGPNSLIRFALDKKQDIERLN